MVCSESGRGNGGRTLDVVVEGAQAIAITLQQDGGIDARKILPLQQNVRPAAFHGTYEGFDEIVVFLAANPVMLPADVDRIVQQRLVVGAHIQQDRQAVLRRNSRQRGVKRHLADGNPHPARALVAEAKNALAVRDHDAANVVIAWIGKDMIDALLVRVAQEQPARFAPDLAEPLAALAHGGRVNDWQQFLDVVFNEGIEERLTGVLQIPHDRVFAKTVGLIVQLLHAPLALFFLGGHIRGQQAMQAEGIAFRLGKGCSLVEPRVQKQIDTGKAGVHDGAAGLDFRQSRDGHGRSPWDWTQNERKMTAKEGAGAFILVHDRQNECLRGHRTFTNRWPVTPRRRSAVPLPAVPPGALADPRFHSRSRCTPSNAQIAAAHR